MTDRQGALAVLVSLDGPEREAALAGFLRALQGRRRWSSTNGSRLQAAAQRGRHAGRGRAAGDAPGVHTARTRTGSARSSASFAMNQWVFNDASGRGYRFLADMIIASDRLNPQIAARLVPPLGRWRRFEPKRSALMREQLERIVDTRGPVAGRLRAGEQVAGLEPQPLPTQAATLVATSLAARLSAGPMLAADAVGRHGRFEAAGFDARSSGGRERAVEAHDRLPGRRVVAEALQLAGYDQPRVEAGQGRDRARRGWSSGGWSPRAGPPNSRSGVSTHCASVTYCTSVGETRTGIRTVRSSLEMTGVLNRHRLPGIRRAREFAGRRALPGVSVSRVAGALPPPPSIPPSEQPPMASASTGGSENARQQSHRSFLGL